MEVLKGGINISLKKYVGELAVGECFLYEGIYTSGATLHVKVGTINDLKIDCVLGEFKDDELTNAPNIVFDFERNTINRLGDAYVIVAPSVKVLMGESGEHVITY